MRWISVPRVTRVSALPRPPKPTRSTRTVDEELAKLDERLNDSELSAGRRLKILQARRNPQTYGLAPRGRRASTDGLLDGFITHAAAYARTYEISYEAFLDFGAHAEVLDKANITPTAEPDGE